MAVCNKCGWAKTLATPQESDEDVELFSGIADAADVLAEIDVQAAEYVRIGLARLRRTEAP